MEHVTPHASVTVKETRLVGARDRRGGRRRILLLSTVVLALSALVAPAAPAFAADDPAPTSSGRVIDSRTGEGIGGITFKGSDGESTVRGGPSAADGSFSFENPFGGRIFTATDPAQNYFTLNQALPSTTGITISMVRGSSINGRQVFADNGDPVAGLAMTAQKKGSTTVVSSTVTDADGRFHLGLLGAGAYVITGQGAAISVGDVEDLTVPDILVHRKAAITVDTTFEGTASPSPVTVSLIVGNTVAYSAATATGSLTFPAVSPGSYVLLVRPSTPAFAPVFYPGSLTIAGATSISVVADQPPVSLSLTVPATKTLDPAPTPSVSGTPIIGNTLTATGTWGPAPVTLTYQWFRNGSRIGGATHADYTLSGLDMNLPITVQVVASKPGYQSVTTTSASVTPPRGLWTSPVPTINFDSFGIGSTLNTFAGNWTPVTVDLAYAWLRNGSPIPGATAESYVIQQADAGSMLSVSVTGSKPNYPSITRTSQPTAAVERVFTLFGAVNVNGRPAVGSVLAGSTGTFSPAPSSFRYQWLRGGVPIAGATGRTYTLTATDDGQRVSLRVSALRSGYATASQTSAASAVITTSFTTVPTPGIIGTPKVGVTLVASTPAWGPAPVALLFQWKANGVPIAGANGTIYTLTAAEAGKTVTLSVTGVKDGYFGEFRESPATRVIVNVFTITPTPTITGTARVGSSLTANGSGWAPQHVSLLYQWQRNGVPIGSATAATYRPTTADAGKRITVAVTGQKSGFASETRTSASVVVAP